MIRIRMWYTMQSLPGPVMLMLMSCETSFATKLKQKKWKAREKEVIVLLHMAHNDLH